MREQFITLAFAIAYAIILAVVVKILDKCLSVIKRFIREVEAPKRSRLKSAARSSKGNRPRSTPDAPANTIESCIPWKSGVRLLSEFDAALVIRHIPNTDVYLVYSSFMAGRLDLDQRASGEQVVVPCVRYSVRRDGLPGEVTILVRLTVLPNDELVTYDVVSSAFDCNQPPTDAPTCIFLLIKQHDDLRAHLMGRTLLPSHLPNEEVLEHRYRFSMDDVQSKVGEVEVDYYSKLVRSALMYNAHLQAEALRSALTAVSTQSAVSRCVDRLNTLYQLIKQLASAPSWAAAIRGQADIIKEIFRLLEDANTLFSAHPVSGLKALNLASVLGIAYPNEDLLKVTQKIELTPEDGAATKGAPCLKFRRSVLTGAAHLFMPSYAGAHLYLVRESLERLDDLARHLGHSELVGCHGWCVSSEEGRFVVVAIDELLLTSSQGDVERSVIAYAVHETIHAIDYLRSIVKEDVGFGEHTAYLAGAIVGCLTDKSQTFSDAANLWLGCEPSFDYDALLSALPNCN